MKKFWLILALVAVVAGSQVFAQVVTTKRQINRAKNSSVQNVRKPAARSSSSAKTTVRTTRPSTGNKFADNVMMCKPYSEVLNTAVSGIDFQFKVSIVGWVNNKCRLNFIAKSTGISEMFNSIYGFDASDAKITTFEPKIRCEFTRQQLEEVGDSILQEQERNNGAKNNMLKNPQDISLPDRSNMSVSDIELMNVILNDRACTILNTDDSAGMFGSVFGL